MPRTVKDRFDRPLAWATWWDNLHLNERKDIMAEPHRDNCPVNPPHIFKGATKNDLWLCKCGVSELGV